jgi:hypothetical protein
MPQLQFADSHGNTHMFKGTDLSFQHLGEALQRAIISKNSTLKR